MFNILSQFLPESLILPIILVITFGVVMVIMNWFYEPIYQKLSTLFKAQVQDIVALLDRDFIKITSEKLTKIFLGYYAFWFILGFLVVIPHYILGIFVGFIFCLASSRLPSLFIGAYHNRRVGKFGMQLIDALTLMANGLRSGLNIPQTIDLVSKEMANPISQEFGLIMSETQLGTTVEASFESLAKRIPTEDMEMLATAITILRETGGNLAETFDTITYTIRERIKILNKISSLVTQGIMQGVIIMLMPFGLAIVLYMIDPNQIMPMFTTPLGLVMVAFMLILQILGGLAIWKIIDIKV